MESPGKDLLRALHEAPEDMAAWLDPTKGEGKGQEGMKDERFKPLREGLVRVLAESSVSIFRRPLKSPLISLIRPGSCSCFTLFVAVRLAQRRLSFRAR